MSSNVAFVSGPIDTGPKGIYFHTHYVARINKAISLGHDLVISPLPYGIDSEALAYLIAYPVSPQRITIFVTAKENEMWGARFRGLGVDVRVIQSHMTQYRDAAMTAASTYDILRTHTQDEAREFYGRLWRDGHVTNTERNWKRRWGIAENSVVDIEKINALWAMTKAHLVRNRYLDLEMSLCGPKDIVSHRPDCAERESSVRWMTSVVPHYGIFTLDRSIAFSTLALH